MIENKFEKSKFDTEVRNKAIRLTESLTSERTECDPRASQLALVHALAANTRYLAKFNIETTYQICFRSIRKYLSNVAKKEIEFCDLVFQIKENLHP